MGRHGRSSTLTAFTDYLLQKKAGDVPTFFPTYWQRFFTYLS
jgi:hypothetical protein